MITTMLGQSEDVYAFIIISTIIYCDTSNDEEDNALQQTTSSTWPLEVDLMKELPQALESQSQMTTI